MQMTIDITPKAVERLAYNLSDWGQHDEGLINDYRDDAAAILRALSAALTTSQAETAAAYEAAAQEVDCGGCNGNCLIQHGCCADDARAIRALTPADSKAALDRMIAEARADALSGPWEDKPDALTASVDATNPVYTKDYKTYTEALELVSNRHSKGSLVGLVNYLLVQNKAIQKGTPHE
jgi:hypothetical protein